MACHVARSAASLAIREVLWEFWTLLLPGTVPTVYGLQYRTRRYVKVCLAVVRLPPGRALAECGCGH